MCYDFFWKATPSIHMSGRQVLLFTGAASGAASHMGIRGLQPGAEEANHCLRSLQRNMLLKGLLKAGLFYLAVAQHQYWHQSLQAWAS